MLKLMASKDFAVVFRALSAGIAAIILDITSACRVTKRQANGRLWMEYSGGPVFDWNWPFKSEY